MRRFLSLTAVAAAALTPVMTFPTPATAADGPVDALVVKVFLSGSPWFPSGDLTVELANGGTTEDRSRFLLHLPRTVKLEPTRHCKPADAAESTWDCGGDAIAAGGRREYTLRVTSTIREPAFGIVDEGWVAGRSGTGEVSRRNAFTIGWPDRLPLKLAASAAPVTDGAVDVGVRVTNAGTFTLGAYSLNLTTPAGVSVVSPACSDSGRMNGRGCELYRPGRLKAGATDRFTVRLKVNKTPVTVGLLLAPANRYTNKDTKVRLVLGRAGATTPPAAGTDRPGNGAGATLPVTGEATGDRTPMLAGSGAALTAVGAGLLLLLALRRRRFHAG